MEFGIWEWTKFICCNRPFDERFDFANKPTDQLYSCLTNENSISNLSNPGEQHFVNGISSISNNLTNGLSATNLPNGHYSIERANRTGSNHSSPNQPQQPQPHQLYEYNLAELALLDNQRAQQYIQQQQTRHRQSSTSAKQTDSGGEFNDLNGNQLNGGHSNGNCDQLADVEAEERPPPLPPLPSKHLLKRNNYYSNIYSAPPQYTDPDYSLANPHSFGYSNPPQYTPSNVPIYGQATDAPNLPNSQQPSLESEFNGCSASNLIHNSSGNTLNKSLNSNAHGSLNHHHHLPHHPNQNSLLTSMDGLRVQINRTKKHMAAVTSSAQLNASHLSANGQTNGASVSNVAQTLVSNLVATQPIRAPTIQRSAEMQVSLKGWLFRLEGAALKQWKRRWFVLGEYCLFYYKNSDEEKMIGSVLLPSYTVTTCTANADGISRKFAFKLEHHNLKTHYLAAECAESMHQWMTLISLSATMTLNAVNYEQLTDGTISSALTATNISRNRPDTQDMMNIILNGNRGLNNENNKNFANTGQPDCVDNGDQLNNTVSTVNSSSIYNGQQRRDSSNLEHSNHDDLKQLSESGSESGFANYKSRRQSKTNSELESFNSVGLPTAASSNGGNYSSIYSSAAHKGPIASSAAGNLTGLPASSSQLVNQQIANCKMQQAIYGQKRSHYVNAPPKPKRQQPQAGSSLEPDFETYATNGGNAYGASNSAKPMHMMNQQQPPDLIEANGYPPHDLYSIPPSHLQQRAGSFSNPAEEQQQTDEKNLYMRRSTLTRQNASDSGRITPMDDANLLPNGHQPPPMYGAQYYDNGNLNPIKSRPKSSQEQPQFDSVTGQHYNNGNLPHMPDPVDQLSSPPYRQWSDFLQAQRSQSACGTATPMSAKQNHRLPPSSVVFNQPPPSNAIANSSTSALAASALSSAAVVALGTQSTSHAQLSSVFDKTNRYDDEHAKPFYSTSHLSAMRTDSPDYMNIEYFKQQQQLNGSIENAVKPNQLMQKLDIGLEQQEKIYQSVLSKNARLEIENLKNEVAKQKQQLKEKEKLNQSLKEERSENDDSKLSNLSNEMDKDIMPPPLNMEARSIKRRDSERSARLSQMERTQEKYDEKLDELTDNTDLTDDNSDEINLSPNPFVRSQFRRSFMNAVYTQRPPPNVAASYHASHAYCGPVDDDDRNEPSSDAQHTEQQTSPKQLTMQQRREQLQRLLHSDESLQSDLVAGNRFENRFENQFDNPQQQNDHQSDIQRAVKPPRNTFKLTKDCLLNSSSVRATPAVIVATPEKPTMSAEEEERLEENIHQQISQNLEQVNQVKKQLAFDLIEPVIVAHKPPRNNSRATARKRPAVPQNEHPEIIPNETERLINVKDRIKLLEQHSSENSSSNGSLNLPKDGRVVEPINLTNRLRSCSLTLCEQPNEALSQAGQRQRHRSLSGQNLSCLNTAETLESTANQMSDDQVESLDNHLEEKPCDQQESLKPTTDGPEKTSIPVDEEDNGYLTMESKLSSNNETDEQQFSLSPSMEPNVDEKNLEQQNAENKQLIEGIDTTMLQNVNFDEVFGATKTTTSPTSSTDADDEQSLKSQTNQTELQFSNQLAADEDDNRKTVDDQFAIYSGMNTIKKAPATYHNARKANDFKLTSALIEPKPSCKQNLPNQFVQVTSAQQIITPAAQFTPEQWNSLQQTAQAACDLPGCSYKPQQIVASSLINRGNNLVFVSNPVINPELMDNNPCYESFDGVMYGQSCTAAKEQPNCSTDQSQVNQKVETIDPIELPQQKEEADAEDFGDCKSDDARKEEQTDKSEGRLESKATLPPSTTSGGQTSAPYYYSDLLPEDQEPNNKENKTDEERSSRNSRDIGVTSLPKLSNNKKLSNSEQKLSDCKTSDEELKQVQEQIEQLSISNEPSETIPAHQQDSQPKELSNSESRSLNCQPSSASMGILYESEMYNQMTDDEPVYENVTRSQSSINLNAENENYRASYPGNFAGNQELVNEPDDYLNESVLRRASHNFLQNAQMKPPVERLNNQEESETEERNSILNNQTPTKLNNSIKNPLNHHRTTPIHLRSPTVAGYATIDSEQAVLINDDYKVQQSSDVAINTNNANNQISKLTWKPNLISHSASNLNKIKSNNLVAGHPFESGSTTSLSSSSAQSLNQLPRNVEYPSESGSYNPLQAAPANHYFRQQSAPNLSINNNLSANNLSNNYHGNNLNNNTEKCLANKQLNLNKNINKINNLLNGPDYVVYENADAEKNHLRALQKQLQQQQELLIQQQRQLQMLQMLQRPAQQPGYSSTSSSSSLLNNSASLLNDSTIPFDHHLKNLENVPVIQKNSQNYHNYQNIFQDDQPID